MTRLILGTGPLGLAIMEAELAKGHEVVLVNRRGLVREDLPSGARVVQGDIGDPASWSRDIGPVEVVYHCARGGDWQDPLGLRTRMDGAASLARDLGALLVYPDHLLAYGNAQGIPMSESSPEKADTGPAAVLAKALARDLLDQHFAGKLKVVVARSPLAYGPRVIEGPLGAQVFSQLLQRKPATMLGDLDLPHSFAYIRDLGKNLSLLADHPEAAGKVWHIPSAPALTQQQMLDILRDMLSRNTHARLVTRPRGLARLFDQEYRAWETVMYQFEHPFVCNHTRFATTFGERCTPHNQALWETLEWYRRNGMGL